MGLVNENAIYFYCYRLFNWSIYCRKDEKSPKTETGGLSSKVGYNGAVKKCMIFVFIFIAVRLDMLLHLNYIKNFTIIVFIVNELVSICENAGVMGVPIQSL